MMYWDEKKLYVAYGSNLNIEQMSFRCPDAEIFGTGVIKNYGLKFWGGVATIVPEEGTDVPVAVWEISWEDEKNLDIYEGYPDYYRKEDISVKMNDGAKMTAMIYIMNYGRPELPSKYYYETVREGYRDFGLDQKYLDTAVESCRKEIQEKYGISRRHRYTYREEDWN